MSRDLLAAVAGRVQTSEAPVREWMTESPVTVSEATPIRSAASIMVMNGFRHLPIVDGQRTRRDHQPPRRRPLNCPRIPGVRGRRGVAGVARLCETA
jgi:CBS domain-containing protein